MMHFVFEAEIDGDEWAARLISAEAMIITGSSHKEDINSLIRDAINFHLSMIGDDSRLITFEVRFA